MRYLITGGAGFIGAHLAESFIADGDEVMVVDNLSTGSLNNLAEIKSSDRLEFVKGDILEMPELEYLVSKVDMVIHLAAAVGVELVVHDPVRTIVTNVHGTERMLNAAARFNKKILITSTSEVYGKSEKDKFSETDDLLIGPSTNSRWSYACSKLLDEFFGMAYYRDRKLPVVIVRLFNTVGPRQTGRYGMVIPRFVTAALANQALPVYGDGKQTRCFCHVYDTVRALKALSRNVDAVGNIFNIGSCHSISIKDLAEKIISQLGSTSEIKIIPYDQAYEKGFEDMRRRMPNVEAVNNCIGWQAEIPLEQIISDVAEYQKTEQKQ